MRNCLAEQRPQLLVLDTWPVMEWLKNREPAAQRFEDLLPATGAGHVLLQMSTISLGEVYPSCWREWDEAVAADLLAEVRALPIQFVHPSPEDVLQAASLKGRFGFSYADGFVATLAIVSGAAVVTGDRDFLPVRVAGVVALDWWGA